MRQASEAATGVLDALGAVWSPDFDSYAAGEIGANQVRCVLCESAPCQCPPVGSPEYVALTFARHGKARRDPD